MHALRRPGFRVVGIDFAPSAIALTRQKFEKAGVFQTSGFVIESDIFSLDKIYGRFDYVLEHTCFCAIHPSRRRSYSRVVRDLLKPGGKLIALWWLLDKQGGPPFAVDRSEIFNLFKDDFHFDFVHEPLDSTSERRGQELFTLMTRV